MAVVSIKNLLETGVHFGHATRRWNPKMGQYIYTSRNGIYIIDLQKTAKKIEQAYKALFDIAKDGGRVIFVGTKKQATEAVKEEALRSGQFYVNNSWKGGTLTNFKTIRASIKRLHTLNRMEKEGVFSKYTKKEAVGFKKEMEKLEKAYGGIKDMKTLPQAIFVVDPRQERNAVLEARKLNIPVFGIVDTNCDPDDVDYVIPANDDAIRAVKLVTATMANAVIEANGGTVPKFDGKDEMPSRNNKKRDNDRRDYKKDYDKKGKSFDKRPARNDKRVDNNKPVKTEQKPVKTESKPTKVETKVENKPTKVETKVEEKPVKVVETKTTENTQDLSKLKVAELKELAKEKGIQGISAMKKADLIEALSK